MTRKNGKPKATASRKKSTAGTDGRSGNKGRIANLKPWQHGQSGNPKGGVKRGESWAELIGKVGDLTGLELADYFETYRAELRKVGRVTLKEAVVIRSYLALLFEPSSSMLNSLMDRAEGKLAQTVTHDASEALLHRMAELGLTHADIARDPAAVQLFRAAGLSVNIATTDPAMGAVIQDGDNQNSTT